MHSAKSRTFSSHCFNAKRLRRFRATWSAWRLRMGTFVGLFHTDEGMVVVGGGGGDVSGRLVVIRGKARV